MLQYLFARTPKCTGQEWIVFQRSRHVILDVAISTLNQYPMEDEVSEQRGINEISVALRKFFHVSHHPSDLALVLSLALWKGSKVFPFPLRFPSLSEFSSALRQRLGSLTRW